MRKKTLTRLDQRTPFFFVPPLSNGSLSIYVRNTLLKALPAVGTAFPLRETHKITWTSKFAFEGRCIVTGCRSSPMTCSRRALLVHFEGHPSENPYDLRSVRQGMTRTRGS